MSLPSPDLAAQALRQRAEEQVARRPPPTQGPADAAVDLRLLHELQVHQVELEMQNEALRLAQADTEQALQRLAEFNAQLEAQVAARTADLVAARDAAQAANRAKTVFLSNMSHELRTPMSGVMGMLDLALGRASDTKQVNWLNLAKRSARHLLSVINDILDIARIESGHTRLAMAPFRLQEVLDDVAGILAPQVQLKGLAFGVAVAPGWADQVLVGDSLRLKQVLLNLAANAVKFTPAGGVALRVQVLQASGAEVLLRFDVRDTGIGIEPADLARLFQAFEQVEQASNRRFEGTGLGLAISDRLVRLLGGHLGVLSQAGRGSLFWFTARLGVAEHAPGQAIDSASTIASPRPEAGPSAEGQLLARRDALWVLLAQDNPVLAERLQTLLQSVGLKVALANSGAQAVDLARTGAYALILMGLQMPQLDGEAAIRAIRQLPGHARTPLLALAAGGDSWSREQCLKAGMDDLLTLPLDRDRLLNALLCWLPPEPPVF